MDQLTLPSPVALVGLPLELLLRFAEKSRAPDPEAGERGRLERILALGKQDAAQARSLALNWQNQAPAAFLNTVAHALRMGRDEQEVELLRSLVSARALAAALLEPAFYAPEEARALAREAAGVLPDLDVWIARRAFRDVEELRNGEALGHARRALFLLDALGASRGAVRYIELAGAANHPLLSAQVARLAVRYRALGLLLSLLRNANPRVRANAVESLTEAKFLSNRRELLRRATEDPHHRVAVNALVALARLGDSEAADRLEALAEHPTPEFRAAAAWGMGELGDPRFQPTLTRLYKEDTGAVRRNVLRALVRLRKAAEAVPVNDPGGAPR